jgi:putative membrane protein
MAPASSTRARKFAFAVVVSAVLLGAGLCIFSHAPRQFFPLPSIHALRFRRSLGPGSPSNRARNRMAADWRCRPQPSRLGRTRSRIMFLDWVLASLHHLSVFSLAAIIAAEFTLIRNEMNATTIARLSRIDLHYGITAALVILFGAARVFFGARGYEYYAANHVFWTKMLLFVIVGGLSIPPTLKFVAWRRQSRDDATFRPALAEIASVKRALWIEAGLFLLIPVAAAAMARGYGMH